MTSRRQVVQFFLMAPLAVRAATPQAPVITAIDGIPTGNTVPPNNIPAVLGQVSLDNLPTSAGPNKAAYTALNVRAMGAGESFADPVTGVRTVKLSSNGRPGSSQYFNFYSTLGLQISQPWGNGDQYTIAFGSTGNTVYLCDYQRGGTSSNYRTCPASEGRFAFSRLKGQERIMYIYTGSQLRRYDVGANAYADSGRFPIQWAGQSTWLQLNAAETWATMTGNGGVSALRLADGTVRTRSISGLDEIYSGYNDVALINAGSSSQVWNLNSDTLAPVRMPTSGFSRIFHTPSMRGYWLAVDSNYGNGVMPYTRISEDGSSSATFNQSGYWGQLHMSGHWWAQPEGTGQYMLRSNWSSMSSGWAASEEYGIYFVRCNDGLKRVLGHSYSETKQSGTNSGGTDSYRAQPHATQSTDGKLVMFTSNMLDGPRLDVFVMEVPVA
jgi:hypothetical protein